jgi:hypothetical protein
MYNSYQKSRKSPLGSFTYGDSPLNARTTNSKENIDVLTEIKEEPLKNIFVSTLSSKVKANIAQTMEAHDMVKRSSSFARMKAKNYQINFFDFYKLKKDFCLISDEERATLIEDLYEFDKCFYLNQMKMQIHKEDDESGVIRLAEKIGWIPLQLLGQTEGQDTEHEIGRVGVRSLQQGHQQRLSGNN